jgi:hypothetical protein
MDEIIIVGAGVGGVLSGPVGRHGRKRQGGRQSAVIVRGGLASVDDGRSLG